MTDSYNTLQFESADQWRAWLDVHHDATQGVWIQIFKKASGVPTVTYAEALDEALCYGWIDGQKKSYDNESYVQKFTPRRPRSMWSKRNIEHVARLTEQGLMTPAGLREVMRAKQDGRWHAAYDSPATMTMPIEFTAALAANPKALAFYETLSKSQLYSIGYRLQTAKRPETRTRRIADILQKLENNQPPG